MASRYKPIMIAITLAVLALSTAWLFKENKASQPIERLSTVLSKDNDSRDNEVTPSSRSLSMPKHPNIPLDVPTENYSRYLNTASDFSIQPIDPANDPANMKVSKKP